MSRWPTHRRFRPAFVGATVLLGVVVWLLAGWWVQSRTWTPSYEVLALEDSYVVRHYPELTVAQVVITGSFEEAYRQAMEALNAYRSGENLRQPVEIITIRGITTEASEKIPRSAPVIVQEDAGVVTVSLVLPAPYTPDTAPRPKDPRVRIDTFDRQRIAVRRMSGLVNAGTFARERQSLLRDLGDSRLLILSEPRAAYYGPSWAFGLLRRGEVHVRVR